MPSWATAPAAIPPMPRAKHPQPCGFVDRPAGAGFPTERPGAFTCGWPDGQPCGLPMRPPTGRRLPTSSTGPHHRRSRSTSNTPLAAQQWQRQQHPARRPSTSQFTLTPTISTAQPSTETQIGHVPEITGHVRRNTQGAAARSSQWPNTLLNRTRNGVPRLGLISFWPKRVTPSRAG